LSDDVRSAAATATRRIGASKGGSGAKLRAMMPWIAKNKLVDKARN
jgi:ketol-acid reductoisomerase